MPSCLHHGLWASRFLDTPWRSDCHLGAVSMTPPTPCDNVGGFHCLISLFSSSDKNLLKDPDLFHYYML